MATLHHLQPTAEERRIADGARQVRHVFVRDLILDASIGVYERERAARQKVRINVDLKVREKEALRGDRLEDVVCYEKIVEGIRAILAKGHINLVETLAERIADMALSLADVLAVRVRVEKLNAIKEAASVGVEIERQRPGCP
ncbi:MAG: dihydroneopterin aldolase [Pseudomonadota bacterium]